MGGRVNICSAARPLYVYELVVYNFCCSTPDTVHSLYPQHLILNLKLLRDALMYGKQFYQLKKHGLRLLVQIGKITIQLAGG